MTATGPLRAVLWDFDGTLVDTRARNMSVNRRIVAEITGRDWSVFPVLHSQPSYDAAQRASANWREFYRASCGFADDEIDRAGARWSSCQIHDRTPVPLFDGVAEVLAGMDGLPQAIVSQNDRGTIEKILAGHGLDGRFGCIIGYAEVEMARQKPAPDGLLAAIELLTQAGSGCVLYIGDHTTDIRCAEGANQELVRRGSGLRVVSVAALWGDAAIAEHRDVRPDVLARSPAEVAELAARLAGP